MKTTMMALLPVLATVLAAHGQDLKTSTDRAASDNLQNRFGAGLMLGEPTGLSLKYWLNADWAVDGGVAESFHRDNGLQLHSDVLWHWFGLINSSHGKFAPYFGAGLRVKFEDGDDPFGFRFPVGIAYMFDQHPIDVFFEVAPLLNVTPSVRGDVNVAIGARFWF